MRYKSLIDVTNKNNSHTIAIDLVRSRAGDRALRILDVGCSAGYLGEYFKTLGHHVTGVDLSEEAVAVAKNYLDVVYCESLDIFFERAFSAPFDVVIFGDVLEHVTNSETILIKTAALLSPNGFVVASIPNIAHLAVRAMLLEGRWEYADLGLLDRDHFRFFTKANIEQLFADANYEIQAMRSVHLDVDTVDTLCQMGLHPHYKKLAKIMAGQDPAADVFQYVALATPHRTALNSMRVVAYVPSEVDSLVSIRVRQPLENWAGCYGHSLRLRDFRDVRPSDLYWGDVFIFQRLSSLAIVALMRALKSEGKTVIFELDDLLMTPPPFLKHHRLPAAQLRYLESALASADAVSTTTERLANQLRTINPRVFIVPNAVAIEHAPVMQVTEDAPVQIIVASSDQVLVEMVLAPLRTVQERYPERIEIMVIGPIAAAFEEANIPIRAHPVMSYDQFTDFLGGLTNPIGVIPLDDSLFSSCKSAIKYFDYVNCGIPTICSAVPPYTDVVIAGQTGLLVENSDEAWGAALEQLITNPVLRAQIAKQAYERLKERHTLDHSGDAVEAMIQSLQVARVRAPALLRPDQTRPSRRERLRFMAQQLLHAQIYKNVARVLWQEGPKGILWRLRRL